MGYVIDKAGCRVDITDTHLDVRDRVQGEARIPYDTITSVRLGATRQPPTAQIDTADGAFEWSFGDRTAEAVSVIQSAVARAHARRRIESGQPRAWPSLEPGGPDGPPLPPSLQPVPPGSTWAPLVAVVPFRSSGTRAKWALALLGLTVAIVVLMGLAMAQGNALVDRIGSATIKSDLAAYERETQTLAGAYYLALIGSAIAFLAWLSRAVDNTPALGGGQPIVSPRAAIGWWFAPLANIVMGYRIVADLWRRMAPADAPARTFLVVLWWILWLGSNFMMSWLVQRNLDTIPALRAYFTDGMILYLVNAASGCILISLVWVTERRAQARGAGAAAHAMDPAGASMPGPTMPPTLGGPTSPYGPPAPPAAHATTFPPAVTCAGCGATVVSGAPLCYSCGRDFGPGGG